MISLDESPISQAAAIWLSVGLILAGWLVYDWLWFKLSKNETANFVISFALIVILAWWLGRLFSGRAMYLQLGAMFGTIMTANVWMRILPVQRRMVAALTAGKEPNQISFGRSL